MAMAKVFLFLLNPVDWNSCSIALSSESHLLCASYKGFCLQVALRPEVANKTCVLFAVNVDGHRSTEKAIRLGLGNKM